ncbi:MAG: hypothetical protein K9W45_12410 [Candidatus Heimdallarchaeum aukensis]|uniref:Gelsolin-like domain-containing protein n=1 Tax=Candidatus Heimdallarchaeum aukensis TaxID=2876573 RepID=A0A9Y1BKA6_9ARCH|nr:MAG: hypothetical protein K9W45_12410 [Candidatus Heimdallarchaeum aukensis]
MSIYIVEKTGELSTCHDKDRALKSENVLIVVSHMDKKVYTWVGSRASPQSKFACARETARMRMELGYRAVNLEEADTTESFLRAIDEVLNGSDSSGTSFRPRPAAYSSQIKEKKKEKIREKQKEVIKKEEPKDIKAAVTPSVKLDASSPKVLDINYVVKQTSTLPPINGMIRDYIIIGDKLYIAPDEDTSEVAMMDSLPDGGFVAEDYLPRLYIENGRVIAVELWREQ